MDQTVSNTLTKEPFQDMAMEKVPRSFAVTVVSALFPLAVIFSVAFTGAEVYPQLSLPLFTVSAFAVLLFLLQRTGVLVNKRAILWIIPALLLSACNTIFDRSFFTYANAVALVVIAAIGVQRAVTPQREIGFIRTLSIAAGDWMAFIPVLSALFEKKAAGAQEGGEGGEGGLSKKLMKVFLGAILAAPLLLVILALLLSADQVFSALFEELLQSIWNWDGEVAKHLIVVPLFMLFAIGYVYHIIQSAKKTPLPVSNGRRADTIVCATLLLLVNLLFLVFTLVQFAFLFTGGFMRLPQGIAYADYARQGFFQLLFVTVINFSLVYCFHALFKDIRRNRVLIGLLTALCFFTGVLIGSSFYRMFLYIGSYGFTTLRLSVITFLMMESVLVLVTVLSFFRPRLSLGRAYAGIGLACLLAANITASDWMATKLNLARLQSVPEATLDLRIVGNDGKGLVADFMQSSAFASGAYQIEDGFIVPGGFISRAKEPYIDREGRVVSGAIADDIPSWDTPPEINHWQNWSLLKAVSAQKLWRQ